MFCPFLLLSNFEDTFIIVYIINVPTEPVVSIQLTEKIPQKKLLRKFAKDLFLPQYACTLVSISTHQDVHT